MLIREGFNCVCSCKVWASRFVSNEGSVLEICDRLAAEGKKILSLQREGKICTFLSNCNASF